MKNNIGEIIRKEREKKDLSQEYVAFQLEMSQAAYSKIERGLTEIKASHLYGIAEVFEVSVYDLLPPALEASTIQTKDYLLKPVFEKFKLMYKTSVAIFKK